MNRASPCVTPQSSDCVLFVGDSLKTQEIDQTCLPRVTEVIEKLDLAIDTINKSIDVKSLQSCLSIDVKKAKVGDVLQAVLTSLCSIKKELADLKLRNSEDLLATPLQLDLSCLGSSCDDAGTTTLLTVLTTLVSEVCQLKQQSNSNNDFYQP